MTIAPEHAPAQNAAMTRQQPSVSIIDEDQAVTIVSALIGLAAHIEAHMEFEFDGEFRSMRATQIGAQLQAGFLMVEDTLGMPLSNYSPTDHSVVERALNRALKEESDDDAVGVLQAVAYLLADGFRIVTE